MLRAEGLDVARRGEPADPRHLDVDDAAGAEPDGRLHVGQAVAALVDADRRLDPLLQLGVVDQAQAVVGQRLLDHGQPVAVERTEELGVGERVGGVAVHVEGEVRERGAHGRDHVEIPAGTELQLDAREAGVDRALDPGHERVERVLDPEVGADGDRLALAAERHVQRHPPALGLQDPPRDLERGARELVALHEVDAVEQILRRAQILADDAGGQVLAHGVERRERVLRGVRRDVGRAALAPGMLAPALHADQDGVGDVLVRVRRLPHEGERDPHPVDVDGLDQHHPAPASARRSTISA